MPKGKGKKQAAVETAGMAETADWMFGTLPGEPVHWKKAGKHRCKRRIGHWSYSQLQQKDWDSGVDLPRLQLRS